MRMTENISISDRKKDIKLSNLTVIEAKTPPVDLDSFFHVLVSDSLKIDQDELKFSLIFNRALRNRTLKLKMKHIG